MPSAWPFSEHPEPRGITAWQSSQVAGSKGAYGFEHDLLRRRSQARALPGAPNSPDSFEFAFPSRGHSADVY